MATYYIKNSGNDSLDGLSNANAWQTISKVNSTWLAGTFNPGDNILFNKNDSFTGTINVSESGDVGSPITIGAYGTGVKPIINGFTTIPSSSWTSVDGSVYYYDITCQSATNNLVTVNGVNTPMGRWPNTGWMTYESHSGTTSITDSSLTNTPNWTGAELVIRKINWTLERAPITNHINSVITYTTFSATTPTDGYGYFIQNDLKTLDDLGDWYYTGTRLYMYFGAVDPTNYVVKITSLDKLVDVISYGRLYITIDSLSFEGSSLQSIYMMANSRYWTIQNCSFDFAGKNCIDGIYDNHNCIITNNTINHTNNTAIQFKGYGYSNTISYNTIENTGVLIGMMYSNDDGADAIVLNDDGYSNGNTTTNVIYNTITNIGHTGIRVQESNYYLSHNIIDTFGLIKNDVGGFYLWNVYNVIFEKNITINGYGSSGGVAPEQNHAFDPPDPPFTGTIGIYIDELCHDISIIDNISANNRDSGILVQMSYNIIVTGNTCYNNGYYQMGLVQRYDQIEPNVSLYAVRNVVMNNNIFFCKEIGRTLYPYMQICMLSQSWEIITDINQFGTFDNNYYARPIDQSSNTNVFSVYEHSPTNPWNGTLMSIAGWQSLTGQDVNSTGSPIDISTTNDLHFIYNDTLINKNYTLSSLMKDVANTDYSGIITLLPFTSLVLIGSGTVVEEETTGDLTLIEGTWLTNRTILNEMFQNLYSRFPTAGT